MSEQKTPEPLWKLYSDLNLYTSRLANSYRKISKWLCVVEPTSDIGENAQYECTLNLSEERTETARHILDIAETQHKIDTHPDNLKPLPNPSPAHPKVQAVRDNGYLIEWNGKDWVVTHPGAPGCEVFRSSLVGMDATDPMDLME